MSFLHRMVPGFGDFDAIFKRIGPAGYTVAINISNTTPELYHTTYPEDWIKEYTENKYAFLDPVMQFAAFSSGVKRWDEILSLKLPVLSAKVYERAQHYNLTFGAAVVKKSESSRRRKHVLSVARSDRQVLDEELVEMSAQFEALLSQLHPEAHLTDRQITILQLFSRGMTQGEVAKTIQASQETVKKDIEKVRHLWGARNTTEAVAMAVSRRLINLADTPIW